MHIGQSINNLCTSPRSFIHCLPLNSMYVSWRSNRFIIFQLCFLFLFDLDCLWQALSDRMCISKDRLYTLESNTHMLTTAINKAISYTPHKLRKMWKFYYIMHSYVYMQSHYIRTVADNVLRWFLKWQYWSNCPSNISLPAITVATGILKHAE